MEEQELGDPAAQGEGKINNEITLRRKMCPYSENRNTTLSFFGEYMSRKIEPRDNNMSVVKVF